MWLVELASKCGPKMTKITFWCHRTPNLQNRLSDVWCHRTPNLQNRLRTPQKRLRHLQRRETSTFVYDVVLRSFDWSNWRAIWTINGQNRFLCPSWIRESSNSAWPEKSVMPWFSGSENKNHKQAHVEESNILEPQPEPTRTLLGIPRPLWQIFQKSIFHDFPLVWPTGVAPGPENRKIYDFFHVCCGRCFLGDISFDLSLSAPPNSSWIAQNLARRLGCPKNRGGGLQYLLWEFPSPQNPSYQKTTLQVRYIYIYI
jgi:hypothetical protein